MSNAVRSGDAADYVSLDLRSIIDRFPGPACLVDERRRPVVANAMWSRVGLAGPGEKRTLPGEVAAALLAVTQTGRPQRLLLTVEDAESGQSTPIDATCLPCSFDGRAATIVLASDCSAVEALQSALAQSRDFHRDLALCSTDTTFEIDVSGRFTYVGPRGFLGCSESELIGTQMRDFVAERNRHATEFLLTSREAVSEAELWLAAPSGAEICMMVSVMPVFDADGGWAGLRGVGREVTEERARQAEINAARRAQLRVDCVLHAMRSEARPSMIISAGASAVLDTVDLDGCAVAHAFGGTFDRVEARAFVNDQGSENGWRAAHDAIFLGICKRCANGPDDALFVDRIGDHDALVAFTRYGGRVNGAVAFLRASEGDAAAAGERWSEDDRHLLRVLAGQISIAMAQLDLFENPFADGV